MQSRNWNTTKVASIPHFFSNLHQQYISRNRKRLPNVISLSFMDNLEFLIAGESMLEIKKLLEKVGKITLDWGTRNAVTYNITKTEAILISKA